MRLSSYMRCMNAYDRDLILLSVPKGIVESETSSGKKIGDWFYTITQEELIQIVRKLYLRDKDTMLLKLEWFVTQVLKHDDTLKPLLQSVHDLLNKVLQGNG